MVYLRETEETVVAEPVDARRRQRLTWLALGLVVAAALTVVGPYVYIHLIEGPAPAPLESSASGPRDAGAATVPLAGTWQVTSQSLVGYRVKEVLFGQETEAVGRTSAVTGSVQIAGGRVTSGSFTADLTTLKSDQSRRDAQVQGRIMDTTTYPTATFRLTRPIALGSALDASGGQATLEATGQLTLRGVIKEVTFPVTARRSGDTLQVTGSIPIAFADWGIPNPSFGPATTDDHGLLEFQLAFAREGS